MLNQSRVLGAMRFSYSRVSLYEQCPFKFKLRYLDRLETLPTDDPQSPLVLGHALHTGIEKDVNAAIQEYFKAYPIITDAHINEAIKLEYWIPKVQRLIPVGSHEVKICNSDFIGYIDLVAPVQGTEKTVDLWDFKYSNNAGNYLESAQLHLYKYFFEKLNPGYKVRDLYYLLIPKTAIRQKQTETIQQYRQRLTNQLSTMQLSVLNVDYQPKKVIEWMEAQKHCIEEKDFPKAESRLCDFCEYKEYCKEGIDAYMLPKNERVPVGTANYMRGWIYGAPFSGKTTFLDAAPDPINLNTDGNTKYVTMQRVLIRDEVTTTGRLTTRKFAWEVFKELIDDLEKGSDFKTVIVDLVEDTREMCRLYMYDKLGIQHESDAGYGKGWDVIKTEYLSTMRRLLSLDYNVFLVSHEDVSKDITKKSGDKITRIAPNIQEAIANKLAGMVDFVARVIVNDDGTRVLSFKSNEVIFGGGRLTALSGKEIPLDWDALMRAYDEARREHTRTQPRKQPSNEQTPAVEETPTPTPEQPSQAEETAAPAEDEQPKRRRRKIRE